MNVQAVIDGINAKRIETGITNQQISDTSGVPLSTVNRILRNATENPSLQNVMDIAGAVGYQLFPDPVPAAEKVSPDNAYVAHILSMYEARLLEKDAHFNRTTAEKNRWILILGMICFVLVVGIIAILLIDITNPTVGWYRREMYSNPASDFWDIGTFLRNILNI